MAFHPNDIVVTQFGPHPRPDGSKVRLALLQRRSGAAVIGRLRFPVDVDAEPPRRPADRDPVLFQNPSDRQVLPEHLLIVGKALAVDPGRSHVQGFVVGIGH
jgi:hypothetical protein